jgi:hypothetical protein
MMAKIDNTPIETDPFERADSPAAIMAYVYAKMGADGLMALLSQVVTDKESLEQDAAELNAVGLPDVATIVLEASANALPASILHCPYAASDVCNSQSWQLSRLRTFRQHRAQQCKRSTEMTSIAYFSR